jgi:flagellar hook-length control protein FliK
MAQRFSELVSQRLIQQVQQGQWKVEIEIHPRDLGSIQIEMQWNDGQLEAMFETTHAATRELLLDNLPRLRESLQKFGTDVAYLGVGADSRQKNGGDGSSHPGRRGRSDRWEDSSAAALSAESGLKLARSGHGGELDVLV